MACLSDRSSDPEKFESAVDLKSGRGMLSVMTANANQQPRQGPPSIRNCRLTLRTPKIIRAETRAAPPQRLTSATLFRSSTRRSSAGTRSALEETYCKLDWVAATTLPRPLDAGPSICGKSTRATSRQPGAAPSPYSPTSISGEHGGASNPL